MIATAFAEVVSVGAIIPFLGILVTPDAVYNHGITFRLIALKGADPIERAKYATFFFSVTIIVAATLRTTLLWVKSRLSQAIGSELSIKLYKNALHSTYAVHIEENSSETISLITTKVKVVVSHVILSSLNIIVSMMVFTGVIWMLITIDIDIALLSSLCFGFLYLVISLFSRRSLSEHGGRVNHFSATVLKSVQEGLGAFRDIKIDGSQNFYIKAYERADKPMRHSLAMLDFIGQGPRFIVEAVGMLIIAVLAYYLYAMKGNLIQSIPMLGAFSLGAQRLLPTIQQCYNGWANIQAGRPALIDILNKLYYIPNSKEAPASNRLVKFEKVISLREVFFTYKKSYSPALTGINMEIRKGSRVGLVGKTGSGKSTIVDILLGLINPCSGQLLVDDEIINDENRRDWQSKIAHVPQSIFIADATIAENIALGIPLAEMDFVKIVESANKAQLTIFSDDSINRLNDRMGEGGVKLSGGERQRIAIARALYKRAEVIVFDEATSALDHETENAITGSIFSLDRNMTIVIVAHRIETLSRCDDIFELTQRGIVHHKSYYDYMKSQEYSLLDFKICR